VNSLGDWGVEPTVGRLLQTTQYPPQIKNHPTHPNKPTNRTRHAPINSKNTAPLFPIHPLAKQRRGWQAYPLPGPLGAMDGAHEPPGVKAHCSRGTASHATERPAASGWAGPRSGVHGVSRQGVSLPARTEAQTARKPALRFGSALWLCALALRFCPALYASKKTTTHKKTRPKPGFFVEADQSAITEATACWIRPDRPASSLRRRSLPPPSRCLRQRPGA